MPVELIDNIHKTLGDDLKAVIKKGDKITIAAASFSVYAYRELKDELAKCEEFRFIFTEPTFTASEDIKVEKEFYIPKRNREKNLYGTEFEIKLRNGLDLRAISKECANWAMKKAVFRSNISNEKMTGFMTSGDNTYAPIREFTAVELGEERGSYAYTMIQKVYGECTQEYLKLFDEVWRDEDKLQDVTADVIAGLSSAFTENSPELIYFITLYNIFSDFLEELSDDVLPNERTGFKDSTIWSLLYDFQKDAAISIINKLEKYNGCILADSVGLGKTFTALAVVKYYESRNKSVLVLCPKKLGENWITFKGNYVNNPIAKDRLRYDVLFHTDLSRKGGMSNGIDLDRLNWGNYDLVVIDESHNFRNGGQYSGGDESRGNRYHQLLNKVIRAGVKTKVLMLSATPVNNRFNDLRNQLAIAYEGDVEQINEKLNTTHSIDEIFRQAQKEFNAWSKLKLEERTTDKLLKALDFDFFEVLDSVTIARSRRHIEKYYKSSEVGKFPDRRKPISVRSNLTDLEDAINYNEIYEQLNTLALEIYTPSAYIFPSKIEKYKSLTHNKGTGLTQSGREEGIRKLMSVNLLKRLESSVYSFNLTLSRIANLINSTIEQINQFEKCGLANVDAMEISEDDDFDIDDQNTDLFSVGKKVKIDLADMDYVSWREVLKKDAETLKLVSEMVADITPDHDSKLQALIKHVSQKIENPINPGNKKVIIFSAFGDTAEYLYDNLSDYLHSKYGIHTALVTGAVEGKTTLSGIKGTLNNILTCFSPISKGRDVLMPGSNKEIDVLIATDCISEGQNLQDCDYLINYDIHWNPVRIIQRFGRVDRIGSRNQQIQLVNFWPDMDLDEYINLKARVETRMKISVMTSTGDDNPISPEEAGDLEYRRQQLKKLQEEVVDMEDMSSGVSIMDLGFNEFRMDLLEYMKKDKNLDKHPNGIYAVAPRTAELPEGTIFVLRNIKKLNKDDNQNRIYPYYLVYLDQYGEVVCDYLSPKKLLDSMRLLCKGHSEPIEDLYMAFNQETDDGKNMKELSERLSTAIESIMDTKEESDIDSLFKPGGTTALLSTVSGLDDFELICFLEIK
ncbi:helicase-related protein [Butyrivibrio sp. LC3010]|uniref:helicase-related protein n=1 Tax=Butyrivibrio sp. LC3010 TaxID=1280680 RepID=UPI0004298D9E|nr:helicase-related protein [Butyrivibrio sp. LC3010]